MRDNPIKKVFAGLKAGKDRMKIRLRERWERLDRRRQKIIILWLLGLFAAIDLAYIVGGVCGTGKYPIGVEHIHRIELSPTGSNQPLNNSLNDTIR